MEISTIVGIILGLAALIVGMVLKGAPVVALVNNPAAYVIILVGTAASLFVAFPMSEIKRIPKILKALFSPSKILSKTEIIKMFTEWASITRREGLLALETKVDEIEDDFLRTGMRMIIDGNDQEFVSDVLAEDIAATEERHRAGALIFSQAGMYAPTLGVLGAVIGLIAALADMSRRFKASQGANNYVVMLTKVKTADDNGIGLVRVNKDSGKIESKVVLDDKKPDYIADDVENMVFYKSGNKALTGYKF